MIDSIIRVERMIYKTKSALARFKERLNTLTIVTITRELRTVLYNGLLLVAIINLLLCIFTLKTLIAISFFVFSLRQYILFRIGVILKNGLISYLPYKLQLILLRRSIFDFLCDMWFFPTLSLYAKAIFAPFIMKPNPEYAAKQLSVLPESSKKIFFTKGIVYVLPKSLKKAFLPTSTTLYNKVYSALEEEENAINHNDTSDLQEFIEIKKKANSDDDSIETQRKRLKSGVVEHNIDNEKNILDKSFKSDSNNSSPIKENNSNIILSSQMMRQVKFIPGKLSDKWDNLELYRKLKKKADDKIKTDLSFLSTSARKDQNDASNLSPINFVMKLIEAKKKKYLTAISYRKLGIVFSLSATAVIINLLFSKTNRKISKKVIVFIFYTIMMGTSFTSLLAILLKPKDKEKAYHKLNIKHK